MKKVFLIFLALFMFTFGISCTNNEPKEEQEPKVEDKEQTNPSEDDKPSEEVTYITVTEAKAIAIEAGERGTSEKYYVKGTIKSISSTQYGDMYITDGENDLHVYGVYSIDGALRYDELEEKPYSGDEVFLYGILKTYKDTPELGASWLQKFISHQGEIDLGEYVSKTIKEARDVAVDSKVIVEGVVSYITYANGMKPNGVFLVDDTASIYVYGLELAGRVKVGEKVKVAGTKTLYILDSEKQNAATFGYLGSVQLQDAIFISSDGGSHQFSKQSIEETTIKKLLETPLSDNITTKIFKVTAIVNKVPGSGFTNYYINDLDNKTGSYCYTLCNGSDYAYLNKYDGLICDVYVTALNCKATKSGTIYRLVPILVSEAQEFRMENEDICDFAIEYYAKPQFRSEYNSDPAISLITKVSNEYIPFDDCIIEYSSLDDLVTIDKTNDEQIMHIALGNKNAKVKITATYEGVTKESEIEFLVDNKDLPTTISIKDALDTIDGTIVTIRGIVMSGCVNQTAFYLNDGSGVVAVRTTSETLHDIGLGNEVVISGKKTHIVKDGYDMVGQLCIDEATLIANLLGNNEYDTSTFIVDKTFDDLLALIQTNQDLTANVYVVKCYLKKVESQYYTNFYLTDETKTKDIYLYAGSGSQYSIYNDFLDGQELTVTLMLVNWNTKSPYRACIVSATDGTTTIINNYNFR